MKKILFLAIALSSSPCIRGQEYFTIEEKEEDIIEEPIDQKQLQIEPSREPAKEAMPEQRPPAELIETSSLEAIKQEETETSQQETETPQPIQKEEQEKEIVATQATAIKQDEELSLPPMPPLIEERKQVKKKKTNEELAIPRKERTVLPTSEKRRQRKAAPASKPEMKKRVVQLLDILDKQRRRIGRKKTVFAQREKMILAQVDKELESLGAEPSPDIQRIVDQVNERNRKKRDIQNRAIAIQQDIKNSARMIGEKESDSYTATVVKLLTVFALPGLLSREEKITYLARFVDHYFSDFRTHPERVPEEVITVLFKGEDASEVRSELLRIRNKERAAEEEQE